MTSRNTNPINTTVDLTTPLSTYMKPTPTHTGKKTSFKLDLNNSVADDVNTIYEDPICAILLKNDCILFGDFVIDFFAKNKLDFKKKVTVFANSSFRHIIERDLYSMIYKNTHNDVVVYGYSQYTYKCSYEKYLYDVIVIYVDYLHKLDSRLIKDHCLLNIDTLVITRSEIKSLTWTNIDGDVSDSGMPLPLGNLLSDISHKRFQILQHINTLDRLNRVITFIKTGWYNNISQITYDTQKTYMGKQCDICHEKIRGTDVLALKCGHYYHCECWYETLRQHITTSSAAIDVVSCPTCRKKYYIYEVI
jgi:hypothetical protein